MSEPETRYVDRQSLIANPQSAVRNCLGAAGVLFLLILAAGPRASWAGPNQTVAASAIGLLRVRFETKVVNSRSYANPFTDVTLTATFIRPDKSRVSFWGFYDGDGNGGQTGSVWRLRFMPDQVGPWSYECSFSDGAPGTSGTFRCIANGAKPGPLRIDPANPRCWVFADGSHLFPRAYTAPELFVAGNPTHRTYWIDYFFGTRHKFNLCNANLLNYVAVGDELNWKGTPYKAPDPAQEGKYVTISGNGLFPFLYSGTRPKFDGGSNVDWLRPSIRCWANVDEILRELEAREVVWFNHWGMIGWDWSGNGRLLVPAPARKPALRYWLARLAPYWNVTWNIAGEWDELLTPAELDELGTFLKEMDPWKHPVTSHALGTTVDRPWVDFRVQQFAAGTSSDSVTNASRAVADYANKPVFAFETSWEATPGKLTPDQVRTGAWGSAMGGAFYLYAECFEPTLTWGDGEAFKFIEIMHDLLGSLAYWKLKPDHAVVNTGSLCLADPGREYVVYRQSGGTIAIDLPGAGPAFQAEWLDPRTGARKPATAVEGRVKRTFACPDARDWVLHLNRGAAAMPSGSQGTGDFFVSPQGKDTWSGKRADPREDDGPFATVARAREAVRELLKTQKEPRPVRVVLRGGTYYLDSPLVFGPEDSGTEQAPVVYSAAAGEKVVLSGGRRLENGRWGELNGHKAWVVEIAEVKAGTWRFRQLFVNGERRPRTRLPKQGEYRIESLPGYTGDFLRSPTKQFVYTPGDIVPTWHNLQDVEIVGVTRWLDNRLLIESVSAESRTVTFDRPSLFALVSSATSGDGTARPAVYWVENVFETLDTPGQWYLDRPRGELYYLPRPGEKMSAAEIIAPRLTQVVRVVGRAGAPVHDLRFEGLIFAHTEWQPPADYASSLQAGIEVPGALLFDYAERCAVTGGGVQHIGNYGVEVGVGCADLEIAHTQLTDLGAGGLRIGHFFSWETDGSGRLTERGLHRKAAMPQGPHSRRITVADNEIAHGGRFTPEAVGVFVGDNADNQIIHNHIYDFFYSGISVGSVQNFGPSQAGGNIIEYNHVHDIGQGMLSDLAGIYTCSTPGSRVAYNIVHDVVRRDYGGWGIYPDEGSHDMVIQKNLVYRCQDGALFAHHNHDITAENNIFAFSRSAQIERGGIGGFALACRRNLVYYLEGKAIGDYGGERWGRDICAFDRNLYWNASGKPVLFANKSWSEWQATGQDKDGLIADPLFVDPAHGDFTLRPGSPASQIGFQPWDLSAIGPRPPSARSQPETREYRMSGNVAKIRTIEGKSAVEVRRKTAEILDFRRVSVFGSLSGSRIGHVSDEAT